MRSVGGVASEIGTEPVTNYADQTYQLICKQQDSLEAEPVVAEV